MGDKNILSVAHDLCTGCGACYNVCPHSAIHMEYDSEGFLFPQVTEGCINCGICLNVCPALHPEAIKDYKAVSPRIYAMQAPDDIRKISSSGGMFSVLANYILKKGGYVWGAAYTEDYLSVEHICVKDVAGLGQLRGSKYVQGDTKKTYAEVRECLESGRPVLYSGVGCQIAGLKRYLKKDYKDLILVDIVCHGGPSPKVYRKYIQELTGKKHLQKVDFREKSFWRWGTATSLFFDDGTVYREGCYTDPYLRAFLSGVSTRLCCSTCRYVSTYRIGDFSLGDFWGVKEITAELDDGQGTSIVLVNNEKAQNILNEIEQNCSQLVEVSLQSATDIANAKNYCLLYPPGRHWARTRFFELLQTKSFKDAFDWAVHSKYDVGVVGWWYNDNYGGTLTYYALHQVLQKMGLSVLMIAKCSPDPNFKPRIDSVPYRFALKHYYISKNHTPVTIPQLSQHCNTFISGSDQIFNPLLWPWSGPQYFLNFVDLSKNLVSYASSFGQEFNDPRMLKMPMARWLRRFNALSARESYGVDIFKNIFGLDAVHVLDPVFLCDVQEYEKIAAQSGLKKEYKYLLSFFLDPDDDRRKTILELSEKLGFPYVNLINADDIKKNFDTLNLNNTKPNIDVEGWLFYYKNADFVITDSFHGTCFSIIFRKRFISLANKGRGTHRFESVLADFGLLDHLVYDLAEIADKPWLFDEIDYDKVFENVSEKVKFSLEWLENAIKNPVPKKAEVFDSFDFEIGEFNKKFGVQQTLIDQLRRELDEIKLKNAEQEKQNKNNESKLKASLSRERDLKGSVSFRVGRAITWGPRKVRGGVRCYKQHGLAYTVKRTLWHITNLK